MLHNQALAPWRKKGWRCSSGSSSGRRHATGHKVVTYTLHGYPLKMLENVEHS
jgi:hypothetical protein